MPKNAITKIIFFNAGIFLLVLALNFLASWKFIDEYNGNYDFFISTFNEVVFVMGVIWINHLVLVKYLFDKKKYLSYGFILLGIILIYAIFMADGKGWYKVLRIGLFYSYTTGTGMAAFFLRRSLRAKDELIEKDELQRTLEINYLKAQVNPHFLFNSLNSIYALSRKQAPETSDTVMQLSALMRYQLESAKKDSVLLKEELEFLENYLLLEEQRLSKRCTIEFAIDGEAKELRISPMLLIPFVENAVKHGAQSTNEKSTIDVSASIKESTFYFKVENSKSSAVSELERVGMGLKNVKRRLNLLYTDVHILEINETEKSYHVHLSINLSNSVFKK